MENLEILKKKIKLFEEVTSEIKSVCDNLCKNQNYLNIFDSKDITETPSLLQKTIMKIYMDKCNSLVASCWPEFYFKDNNLTKFYASDAIHSADFDPENTGITMKKWAHIDAFHVAIHTQKVSEEDWWQSEEEQGPSEEKQWWVSKEEHKVELEDCPSKQEDGNKKEDNAVQRGKKSLL